MDTKTCLSCKKKVANNPSHTSFPCPQCSKYEIVRCKQCRIKAIKYSCPQCSFTGPN